MKARIYLPVFLVDVINCVKQFIVVAFTQHFADRHHLPFPGAMRTDTAGELHPIPQFLIQRQFFEPGFLHGNQLFGQLQKFVGFAFALAFTDFKRIIFDRGFVHRSFFQEVQIRR